MSDAASAGDPAGCVQPRHTHTTSLSGPLMRPVRGRGVGARLADNGRRP